MSKTLALILIMAITTLPAVAGLFRPKGASIEKQQTAIRQDRREILAKLYDEYPEAKDKIKKAIGYGTFNNKSMHLFMLSTGHGYGVVTENKTGKETFMAMGSVGAGVGLGVKDLSVVFIFKDAKAMKQFVDVGWQFGGQADASAKAPDDDGIDANAKGIVDPNANPFEIYEITDAGISLQATVNGTKYWKDKKLNSKIYKRKTTGPETPSNNE
jgi:lipid-binding SYLF domain-containing protein